jgi:hypothetical protein
MAQFFGGLYGSICGFIGGSFLGNLLCRICHSDPNGEEMLFFGPLGFLCGLALGIVLGIWTMCRAWVRLTTVQRGIVSCGAILSILAILFPPFYFIGYGDAPDGPTMYQFLPLLLNFGHFDAVLDFVRLGDEFGIVLLGTVAGVLIANVLIARRVDMAK